MTLPSTLCGPVVNSCDQSASWHVRILASLKQGILHAANGFGVTNLSGK